MLINFSLKSIVDDSLINKVARKEEKAFEELYFKTKKIVFCISFSMSRSISDSEDITQEVYLKIINNAHFYQSNNKALSWIYTITRNTTINYLKSKKSFDNIDKYQEDIRFSTINNQDDQIILKTALKTLNDEELKIVLLHNAGLKFKELSNLFDIPISTIISKYNRSLMKMRKDIIGGMVDEK